jgi:hypothetical protein
MVCFVNGADRAPYSKQCENQNNMGNAWQYWLPAPR